MAIGIPTNGKVKRRGQSRPTQPVIRLEYPGKKPAEVILAGGPGEYYPSSIYNSSGNRLYRADNLGVLSALAREHSIAGQVRLVYIDPPFSTASEFQCRKQNHAYDDSLVGAEFLEFLRERLIWIHRLLADDGSLYLHLDERMAFHFRIILDEIFGEHCYRNFITRKKCNPKNYTRKTYGNVSDYILFYTKSDNYLWNRPLEPWDEERAIREYQYIDEKTGRRYKKVPIHAPGIRHGETGKPWRGINPPPGKHWQYLPSKLDEMDERGEIYWSPNGNPRRMVYLEGSAGVPLQDIWLDMRDAHNQNIRITGYPTEKNPDLLARIIEASSNPGDLVMDCFSGSGTTLAVASNLDRRWIGIDNSDEAIRTTLRRFSHGLERMGDFVNRKKPLNKTLSFHQPITDFTLYFEEQPRSSSHPENSLPVSVFAE
jgi:adenine-specific DNA-methyltransferase